MARQRKNKPGIKVPGYVKKTARNIGLSAFLLIGMMLLVPTVVDAVDQRVVANSDAILLHSLSVSDCTNVFHDNIQAFGLDETGDGTNVIVFTSANESQPIKFTWDNIDWMVVSKVVLTYEETNDQYLDLRTTTPSNRILQTGKSSVTNETLVFEPTFIQKLVYNDEPTLIIDAHWSGEWDVSAGEVIIFSIEIYGIEDQVITANNVAEYAYGAFGVIMMISALMATPFVNPTQWKMPKHPKFGASSKRMAKRSGSKKSRRK